MKNLLFLAAFVMISQVAISQSIPKGALVGIHSFTVKLNGNTTQKQVEDFINNKWIPASNAAYSCEGHMMKFVRGEAGKNKLGMLIIYKNEATRNKYYGADRKLNAGGKAADAKMKSVNEELAKLGTLSGGYTDWLVQ